MAGNYVVYLHQNKTNGKRYIGITNNVKKRWSSKGKRYENCPRFAAALKKYGWENFYHVVIIKGLSLAEANLLEQFYIATYKTQDPDLGYNLTSGGQFAPTMQGKKHSSLTRKKMSESAKGRTISKEQREKHSERMKGLLVGERNGKSRKVLCVTTGEIFSSQREAANKTGVNQSKISLCCCGKRSHTHGLKWKFID